MIPGYVSAGNVQRLKLPLDPCNDREHTVYVVAARGYDPAVDFNAQSWRTRAG